MTDSSSPQNPFPVWSRLGFMIGLPLLMFTFFSPPLLGLSADATKVALFCVVMALFWITEALPIPVTSLLPVFVLPLLGISSTLEAAAPYANPVIYLFIGGFLLSIAMERWHLHRRIALRIIGLFGTSPRALVLSFLIAAVFISFWVQNSSTAMMLMPIALSVHALLRDRNLENAGEFGSALVLTAAYGASIGGMAVMTSTMPNMILKGFMEKNYGIEVTFAQWLGLGLPLVIVAVPLVYLVLTRVSFRVSNKEIPGLRDDLAGERAKLGRVTWPEVAVSGAFLFAVTFWMARSIWRDAFPGLTDEIIAMIAACALFVIPADWKKGVFILDWKSAQQKLPWDVLILFGGGLSLAAAFEKTNLAQSMASSLMGFGHWHGLALVFLVVALMVVATALTSNTATTAALLPAIGALAQAVNQPALLLAMPVAIAASADFMLPVGTPPNAIAYGSGLVTLPRMIRAGIWVDLLFILLIPLMMWTVGRWVFNV